MFDVKNLSFPKFGNIFKKRIFLSVIFEKKLKKLRIGISISVNDYYKFLLQTFTLAISAGILVVWDFKNSTTEGRGGYRPP